MSLRVAALHRYPVKGLSPEPLARAALSAGDPFPGDRLYAVENGPSGFDAAAPEHQPKIKFLMLMRHARLAELRTRYDDATTTLAIARAGREVARGALTTAEGRAAIEAFLAAFMADALRGPPKVVAAPPGFRFTDTSRGHVSLVNLATVAAIGRQVGRDLDPLRFRANVHIEGLPAFAEHDLVGRTLHGADGLRIEVVDRTGRCAATGVDPATGRRDLDVVGLLDRDFGHTDCGLYARVAAGGVLAPGDALTLAPAGDARPS